MYQIRIHGRGGQGVVTAAELIAIAAFNDGKRSQAFPSFGVERTGAPIEAFTRIDSKPIRTREHVYEPNVLIIQDPTLLAPLDKKHPTGLGTVDVAKGCDLKTLIIINTTKNKNQLKTLTAKLPEKNIFPLDATKIAMDTLGRNIVNTVILGAFAKVSGLVSLESLKKAIEQKFKAKGEGIVNKNIKAIEKAYTIC